MKVIVISGRNSEIIEQEIVEELGFEQGSPKVKFLGEVKKKKNLDTDLFVVTDYGRDTIINWEDVRQLSKNNPTSKIYLFTEHENVDKLDLEKFTNVKVIQVEKDLPLAIKDIIGVIKEDNKQEEIEEDKQDNG